MVKICIFVFVKKTIKDMNNLVYAIGDFFEATFVLISASGNMPNILLALVGAGALAFCMKVVTAEKNICE